MRHILHDWEDNEAVAIMHQCQEAIATCNQLYDRDQKGECPADWGPTHLAGIYAELGREDEARALIAEALKINPSLSLESFKGGQPFKNPAHMRRELETLRKAGLPKKPSQAVP